MQDAESRRAELERQSGEWRSCERCALAATRTQVVVGSGDPDADLMFVGEAPGFHEDRQGVPFVGQAGKLLEGLLEGIGLTRERVYIANVLKCRPPGNRDPQPDEIEACQGYLLRQVELIRPRVVCTLGNFATKLLSGSPLGITRAHGRPLAIGDVVWLRGDLGSGKTAFVRAACAALAVEQAVTSPTYTVGNRYTSPHGAIAHVDLYRSTGLTIDEWADLEPYFEDAIVFVEWPDA